MRRNKQVYYRESSDEEENVVANLTDSREDDKPGSDDDAEYVQTSYVEEDILNPDISQILTWRTERAITGANDSYNLEECEFLVKFKNYSYHNLEWIRYNELEEYNKRASMKLKRFIQTHKRNNLLPYLKNDFEVPIDNNWLIPERILYTTDMFSVIFPDTPMKQRGKWQERCGEICRLLMHYVDGINSKGKVKYGIYFLTPMEDPDEELRKKEEHDKMAMGDAQMGEVDPGESHAHDSSGEELTLSILLNRISGGKYKHPNEFWIELGQLFKNVIRNYPDETASYRKISDKLRVLAYHLYVDWYSLFSHKEKERERRRIEAERVKFLEMRNEMRRKRREEWKAGIDDDVILDEIKKEDEENKKDDNDPIGDYTSKKAKTEEEDDGEGDNEEEGKSEEKKDDKKDDNTFKDVNEESLATSNAFPATSTQDNMSVMNPQRDHTYQVETQMQAPTQSSSMQQNMNNHQMNMGNPGNMGQGPHNMMGQGMNPGMNSGMNQGMNPGMNQNMNNSSRLPSLSSLPINNMANQGMMNQPMRLPSMFGQNQMGNQGPMNPMGMPGANPVFQGGRMVHPGYVPGMNMYGGNMQQMMQYPGMQNQFYNQMQRPGMMGYNPAMGGFNPQMMNNGMYGQFQNPMMMRGGPYGNPQFSMLPPGQQMALTRGMAMNPNMNRNQKPGLENLIQGDQYVPGSLEDQAINALTNTEFKAHNNDLMPDTFDDEGDKVTDIDPGPYNLSWLLDEGETEQDFIESTMFTPEELNMIVSRAIQFDQLYLVKWTNLSYTECTWEPYSLIQQYDELIESFEMRNKKLGNDSRNKLSKDREVNRKLVEYLGISEKRRKNNEEEDIDNHLRLFKYRISLFANKVPYELYKKEKGKRPIFKKGQTLKDYQVNGTNWLVKAWHDNRNVILADEMGLGKTVQTISYLNYLYTQENIRGPFCVVAPLTTLSHWKKVVDEWTDMNAVLYYDQGGNEGRAALRLYEWYYTDITNEGYPTQKYKIFKFNIILTSFEVFCSDLYNVFLDVPFKCIVIDEAHRLKNRAGKTLTLLKEHPCVRVFLLTGTPVQNNTKELFTLLNYIEPLRFRSMDLLLEKFGDLKEASQVQHLLTLLRPYFLRRLKEEVEDSIPPLEETVVEVGLTKLQTVYYKGIYGENKYMLSKLGSNSAKAIHLNNMDIQLRKCCNHLYLLKGVEEELESKCSTEHEYQQSILDSSGKMILLDKFIQKFKDEGHKMLIFSQFKKMLEIMEIYLRHNNIPYEMLTGSVKSQDRVMSIQRFNDDPSFGVFLLTTRAGGLGINLTSARVVIIFDSDWNPQNDLQAIARAHRIGQTHEVKVYRFITKKTYEEQMFNRASKKLGMEQALFKGSKDIDVTKEGIGADLKPDQKEIENLLRYGAYAFIDNDGDDIVNMDIEDLFNKKKSKGNKKKGKSLNKSTFNVDEYEKKLDKLNDDDFWKEILPTLEVLSVQALEKKLKFDRADIVKNEDAQKEFLENLRKLVNQLLDTKRNSADVFSTEDDETRLRDLMMKFCKVHKMKPEIRDEAKKLLRELNQSIELLSYEAKFKEEQKEEESRKELENSMDKDDEISNPPNEEKSRGNNKQRVRRKRKANNNVVYDQDNMGDEFDDKAPKGSRKGKKNTSDDGDEYVLEGTSEKPYSKPGEKDNDNDPDHSELVYADSKSHSYRLDPNADEDMKDGSELIKDNVRTYEMNISAEDRTDPIYGGLRAESDSSSNKESLKRREMKRQQKYQMGEFNMPKHMPYGNHPSYNELFPSFCGHCYYKVDMAFISWSCRGHCGKVYHDRCKKNLDNVHGGKTPDSMSEPSEWICWLCKEGKAECFICKKVDPVKWSSKKPVPFYIKSNSGTEEADKLEGLHGKDDPMGKPRNKEVNEDTPKAEPHLVNAEGEDQKETEFKFTFEKEEPKPKQKVIKCYTGSCARHFHLECLSKSRYR